MGRTHDHPNTQTPQEAAKGGREIASTRGPDPPRITIEGDRARPSLLSQDVGHRLQGCLRMKIGVHLRGEDDGGAHIHHVQDFHHMLLLAIGISWHRGSILKINLPGTQWGGSFHGLRGQTNWSHNTPMTSQHLPDGACRAR